MSRASRWYEIAPAEEAPASLTLHASSDMLRARAGKSTRGKARQNALYPSTTARVASNRIKMMCVRISQKRLSNLLRVSFGGTVFVHSLTNFSA
mmetsp:Transcript_19854/g.33582  ORF Transcript_19854/g.33582 Transcript_19854/m.33582 type:complete len:94 (-) Transcript_19854:1167-1448(-)